MHQDAMSHQFDATCQGLRIDGDRLHNGRDAWDLRACAATIEHGDPLLGVRTDGASRGRRHHRENAYLCVAVPGDRLVVDLRTKDEDAARMFAHKLNSAARYFQTQAPAAPAAAPGPPEPAPPVLAAPEPVVVPPGWYVVGRLQRYWDGTRWTSSTAPAPGYEQ